MASDDKFVEGKRRLEEIGHRLGSLLGGRRVAKSEAAGAPNFLNALGSLIEQLGKLAEESSKTGRVATKSGEFSAGSRARGVYGFSVKFGLGDEAVKLEPFGNVRKNDRSGDLEVGEIREPITDLFDESTHVLIVAEVPGVMPEDVSLELHEDILTLAAARGDKKYRKEILLPASFSHDRMSFVCRSGILEIRLAK